MPPVRACVHGAGRAGAHAAQLVLIANAEHSRVALAGVRRSGRASAVAIRIHGDAGRGTQRARAWIP